MASTFTTNVGLEEPARGDQVGTWDTPVNNNMTLIDLILGGTTTIPLAGAGVVLSAAQFKSKTITFSSTLTASVTITFPTSFIKSYEIQNLTTGTANFTVTLTTTAAGGTAIALPPGEFIDVVNDGTNMKFKNLGRVGAYWDHAGSSVPNWVSACTVPPYLNCDATAFSSVTYPQLAVILGGTTLPDARGSYRATLNQGTARMTTAGGGVDGNTARARGGAQTVTLLTSQLPSHTHANTLTDPGHLHGNTFGAQNTAAVSFGGGFVAASQVSANTGVATTGMSINNATAGSGSAHATLGPTYVGGITMIRAA